MKKIILAALMLPLPVFAQTYPSPTFSSITLQNPLTASNGGTGVANSSTITLGGNLTTSGANPLTFTTTGTTNVTLPTSGTLLNGSSGATAGANSNITSLSGLTTPLSVPQGGTGVTSSTGTGSVVLSTSPSLTTPALGTPSSVTLTHGTGLPISTGVSGLGTGVATGLGNAATGSGSPVLATSPAIATPTITSPTISNLTATGTVTLPANSITNSALAQAAANTVECNASTSTANIAHCVGFQLADPGPTWASLSGIYDSSRVAVNNYPLSLEFGGGTVGVAQALVGAVSAPSSATGVESVGVSGYSTSASTSSAALGVLGFGLPQANNVSAFGGNFVSQNCGVALCSGNDGYTNINLYSAEFDLNVAPIAGGGPPAGNAIGIYVNGFANAQPTGRLNGVEIDHAGTYPWKVGYQTDTGCCTVGVSLGAAASGVTQNSQPVQFNGTNGSGATNTSQIFGDSSGNLQLLPASGALVSINNGSLQSLLAVGPTNVSLASSAKLIPTYPAGIAGNTTGATVTGGSVGELQSTSTTATSMTSGTAANCSSLLLSAGDWDVTGQVVFNPAASTTVSSIIAGLTTASATVPATGKFSSIQATMTTGASQSLAAPMTPLNISSPTTIYLVGYANFGASTMTCNGYINARRR